MFDAKVQQVIITTLSLRGEGVVGNPYRRITEIWTLDGEKIAEVDHYKEQKEHDQKD